MKITPIKTHRITIRDNDLSKILDRYVKSFRNGSILVVTSKIISICEGGVLNKENIDKKKLIIDQSESFLSSLKDGERIFTIKNGFLISSSGIDESNGNGCYILWPKDPQGSANIIRKYILKRFSVKKAGVIITDSRTIPFRRGVTGMSIAYSGFSPLNDRRGEKDIFNRKIKSVIANVIDGLAIAAVTVMGEVGEQTPLATIEDIPFVRFKKNNPSQKEIDFLQIAPDDDIYSPFFKKVKWKKGGL